MMGAVIVLCLALAAGNIVCALALLRRRGGGLSAPGASSAGASPGWSSEPESSGEGPATGLSALADRVTAQGAALQQVSQALSELRPAAGAGPDEQPEADTPAGPEPAVRPEGPEDEPPGDADSPAGDEQAQDDAPPAEEPPAGPPAEPQTGPEPATQPEEAPTEPPTEPQEAAPAEPPGEPDETAPAESPGDGEAPADPAEAAVARLRAAVDARRKELLAQVAELRAEAIEKGKQVLQRLGEKPAALRQELERVVAVLNGEALSELAAIAGDSPPAAGALEQVGEFRQTVDMLLEGLPDPATLAQPPQPAIDLPDPAAAWEAACAEGGRADPGEFEAEFTQGLEAAVERARSHCRTALFVDPRDLAPEAMAKEVHSLVPSSAVMLIQALEELAETDAGGDLNAWSEGNLQRLRSELAASAGLVELPVREGERFDPRRHQAFGKKADDKKQMSWTVREILRPGYRLASGGGPEPLRAALVEVAA